jgi:TonB family protein
MTRFETKCLVGAAGLHSLLVGILLVSAAFQGPPPEKPGIQLVTIIPSTILDRAGVGGGTPIVTPPAQKQEAAAQQQQPPPAQKQPERTPPKHQDTAKPDPTPEPPKPTKHVIEPDLSTDQPINNDGPKVHTPKPTKHVKSFKDINVDLGQKTSIKNHKPKPTSQSSDSESDALAYNNNLSREIGKIGSSAVKGIGSKTSGLTVLGNVGAGGGGEAFAGYENVIGSIFYHAWTPPEGISDISSDTEVEIVVARDGTIISANITTKSGKSAMDKSVFSALRKVKKLPPFPQGAQDSQRTFQLVFNLKAKQSAG